MANNNDGREYSIGFKITHSEPYVVNREDFEIFFRARNDLLQSFKDQAQQITDRLHLLGISTVHAKTLLCDIARLFSSDPFFGERDIQFAFDYLNSMFESGNLTLLTARLLVDTVAVDDAGNLQYYDYFLKKLHRVLESYAGVTNAVDLTKDLLVNLDQGVLVLSEEASVQISSQILASIRNYSFCLGLSNYSSQVDVHSGENRTSGVSTEVYAEGKNIVYVRVGYLFFIDSKYQNNVSPHLQTKLKSNFFFIDNMSETEFGNRLGYFTNNTIASMMETDFKGKGVIDCGSGSGILSIVAKRLGATFVAGVEINTTSLSRSQKEIETNGYSSETIAFIQGDIQSPDQLIQQLPKGIAQLPLVVISNIGHWRDYTVTNISSIRLANELRKAGYAVSTIICGGYDGNIPSRVKGGEVLLLGEMGVDGANLPQSDRACDQHILEALNFQVRSDARSEVIFSPGMFPRQAGSLVAEK